MKTNSFYQFALAGLFLLLTLCGCGETTADADTVERDQQAKVQKEMVAQVGQPNIINFQEKRLLKDVYELRDQNDLITWTYTKNLEGRFVFQFQSVGYGISSATQFNNPEKIIWPASNSNTLPQAEPNGTFAPESADGTWLLVIDPVTKERKVAYIEDTINVFPYRLSNAIYP